LELPGGRAAPRGGNRPRRRRVLSPDPPLASVPKMGHTALRWRFRYPELRDVFDKFVAAVRRGRSERQVKKGLIAAAAVVALLIAAAGGAVNAKSASAKVPVPQGISALLLTNTAKHGGSSPPVFPIDNQTPANTPEDVTFVLDIQNRHQLESLVSNNMNGRFLSVDQFARSFGQSRQNIDALQSYLKHYGITTNVMADGLDVQANGTAQQFDNALGTHQRDYRTQAVPAHDGHPAVPARNFHGSSSNPLLPRQLASFVDVILGLTNYPTFSSNAIRVPQSTSAGKNTLQLGDRTPEDFAKDYNLPNGSGRGSTIGIV